MRGQIKDLPTHIGKATGGQESKLENQLDKLRAEEKQLLDDRARRGWPDDPPELAEIARLRSQGGRPATTKAVPAAVAIGIREGGVPAATASASATRRSTSAAIIRKEGRGRAAAVPGHPRRSDASPRWDNEPREAAAWSWHDWLAAPDNPLTARVMVNRVWLHLFGRGPGPHAGQLRPAGRAADPPRAARLPGRGASSTSGWSVKKLIREIVLSSTYQQTSFADTALLKADPENRLLGRVSRKRLSYEALRDSILSVGGEMTQRTLYEPIERGRIDPARALFDGPDPLVISPQRPTSTTTPQALYLMNSPLVAKAAERLAERVQKDAALKDNRGRIGAAYLRLVGRPPSLEETRIGEEYLARGTWANYLQALICSNEFVYLD